MSTPHVFIALSSVVLAIAAQLVSLLGRKENRLTTLAGLAFRFAVAEIIFGDARIMGYRLMRIGGLLAVIDMSARTRKA